MATATTALISIDEYLRTMYHPDCEFVDGALQERSLGEFEHGRIQTLLAAWLANHERAWSIITITEQRTRVTADRVRIPDVCVIRADAPREAVRVTPALLCIEILSPEDRLTRTVKVMEDYLAMGVENLWIIDPLERVAYTYTHKGLLKAIGGRLEIAGSPIHVDLPTLFAALD